MTIQITKADDLTHLCVVGDRVTPLISTRDFEVFEMSGPEGSGPPPHLHDWDEGYVVLNGSIVLVDEGGVERELLTGDRALVPGGTVHSFRIGSDDTRFLSISGGQTVGGFFAEVDAEVPPGPPTPEIFPKMAEIAARNGIANPYVDSPTG